MQLCVRQSQKDRSERVLNPIICKKQLSSLWVKAVAMLLVLLMLGAFLPQGASVLAQEAADVVDESADVAEEEPASGSADEAMSYRAYASYNREVKAGSKALAVFASDYLDGTGKGAQKMKRYKGRDDAVIMPDSADYLEYKITVPETGMYHLELSYFPIKSNELPMELGVMIDGAYPFAEAERFKLNRVFRNETSIQADENGNQYAPRQVEYFSWFDQKLRLANGRVDGPVAFRLSKGTHIIRLVTISGTYALSDLYLRPARKTPGFATYVNHNPKNTGGEEFIKLEAENASFKSDNTLRPASDRTNATVTPYHPSKVRMNMVSSSWGEPGQWLEWEFEAPVTGWYNLGFHYQQYYNINFFVTRRLLVDGKVPFAEAEALQFDYNLDWEFVTMKDANGKNLRVYLEEGYHTIRMEAVLGSYGQLLDELDSTVSELNDLYRQIIMVTGVSPDKYQDYYLDKEIPGLVDTLTEGRKSLLKCYERIKQITNSRGAQASLLEVFANQIDSFLEEPETISERITEFKSNIGSLAAWVLDLKTQPMDLDYIYLYEDNAPVPAKSANVFQQTWHEIRSFFASFFEDYNSMGATAEDSAVDVWVSSGREQTQIIRMMINDMYTPKSKVNVNLRLVNAGLVEAFLSGQAPDVVLTIGRGQPVNLAVRGALVDLTQFDDFDEVKEWFLPTALDPYYFEDGCYGLPDTQSFYMMFYRTDIFEQMGLEPPKTWDELYTLIGQIQRFNMEVGIPYTSVDAFGAADAGMGVRNIFPALLMQNGGTFYSEDRANTALGTEAASNAFVQWCRLYKDYGLQVSYDFYNRFRTGEMPLAIATYTEFARLQTAAPEIAGKWEMIPIPGVERKDGSIDRSQAGAGTACVIVSKTKQPKKSWDFLKWYCSSEAQARYAKDVEAQMGVLARVPLANTNALNQQAWTGNQLENIITQREDVREIPEVLGGYYLIRGLDNAFREVVYDGKNDRESLRIYNRQINDEISRKRKEFGFEQAN